MEKEIKNIADDSSEQGSPLSFGKYLVLSVFLHFCLFAAMALLLSYLNVKPLVTRSIIELIQSENSTKEIAEETPQDENEELVEPEKEIPKEESVYYDISRSDADTSSLEQIYSESTLNVTIKYPRGWVFIDQNVKKKLDGVTFWLTDGVYNPPPYVHLEVKEKYLFNESRFKYSFQLDDNIAYYNDPEELEDQVSQIIYIRTDSEEDFSLKLIMNGKESFKRFQPVFFGMIKSFKFGTSIF